MKQNSLKNKQQISRFAVVGIVNTAVDFVLLFLLKSIGLPAVSSNILSSTTAFVLSFTANKKYTFKNSSGNFRKQILLFVIVTLTGLWVFQTIVIFLTEPLLTDITNSSELGLLISKLLATGVSMTWNYIMYAKIVFSHSTDQKDQEVQ